MICACMLAPDAVAAQHSSSGQASSHTRLHSVGLKQVTAEVAAELFGIKYQHQACKMPRDKCKQADSSGVQKMLKALQFI